VTPHKEQALRCAIYTRKSSEEGLEHDFNSLHAQREACEAYIRSQQGEGWRLRKTPYNDGGLSGATMERPALKQLLADIEEGLVDVVVVYKVDRLTRRSRTSPEWSRSSMDTRFPSSRSHSNSIPRLRWDA